MAAHPVLPTGFWSRWCVVFDCMSTFMIAHWGSEPNNNHSHILCCFGLLYPCVDHIIGIFFSHTIILEKASHLLIMSDWKTNSTPAVCLYCADRDEDRLHVKGLWEECKSVNRISLAELKITNSVTLSYLCLFYTYLSHFGCECSRQPTISVLQWNRSLLFLFCHWYLSEFQKHLSFSANNFPLQWMEDC